MRFIYTKTFTRAFALFVGIALFIILDATGYMGIFKAGFFKTYGSAAQSVSRTGSNIKDFFATLIIVKNLARENAELNQKIDELSFENARLQSAKQENTALRRALNFVDQSQYALTPVKVESADSTGFRQTLIVSASSDGTEFRMNAPIIVAPGILVGKITKIFSNTAEVTLITDPSMVVNAEVAESGARGLIKGEHGLGLTYDLVTQSEVIKAQDKIITSGLSGDFPRGLLVGEISAISSSTSELFQKAYVTPAADLRHLRFLFMIN